LPGQSRFSGKKCDKEEAKKKRGKGIMTEKGSLYSQKRRLNIYLFLSTFRVRGLKRSISILGIKE
jgi:hypothetical protein